MENDKERKERGESFQIERTRVLAGATGWLAVDEDEEEEEAAASAGGFEDEATKEPEMAALAQRSRSSEGAEGWEEDGERTAVESCRSCKTRGLEANSAA